MRKVGIIMGSQSDCPALEPAMETLRQLEVPFTVRILSAHRTPGEAAAFAAGGAAAGYGVFICAAGMAAHLAGAFAANTVLPVIGVPMKSGALEGMDALLSTVMMPPGIPVATVGINGAKNAALLAAEILAIHEPELTGKLLEMRSSQAAEAAARDRAAQEKYRGNVREDG
ncbi:MAG: 5-(carboxyamino)imidazole ribonucleotide mutase [Christensenellales bacterium]|jgi:5-(carboxyamino)imidazole ribonucleotide mutase